MKLFCRIVAAVLPVALFLPPAVLAQAYPSKPVRVVVVFPPGGSNDIVGRVVFQKMSEVMGQQFLIDNRGGAAGTIGSEIVVKSPPDGYTVMVQSTTHVANAHLYKTLPYDVLKDFIGVTTLARQVGMLVVHPSLPVKSVKELIALAKARPGDLNYSAGGGGSTPHVAGELFKYLAGVNIVRVRYKGSGPSMIGLITGEVQLMFGALGPTLPLIKQGKARPLAISTPKRSALVPDLPPVADVLPGFSAEAAIGFFVPKRTAPAIVKFLHQEIVPALKGVDAKVLAAAGVEIVVNAPEEFAAFIKSDMARMSNMLKSANFSN